MKNKHELAKADNMKYNKSTIDVIHAGLRGSYTLVSILKITLYSLFCFVTVQNSLRLCLNKAEIYCIKIILLILSDGLIMVQFFHYTLICFIKVKFPKYYKNLS